MNYYIYEKDSNLCRECGLCRKICPSPDVCIGCEKCYVACPHSAIIKKIKNEPKTISITVDNKKYRVPSEITLKKALETIGIRFSKFPEKNAIFSPCKTGTCYNCAVLVNNKITLPCISPVLENSTIITKLPENAVPLRAVGYFEFRKKGIDKLIDTEDSIVCFLSGCNFRCPACAQYNLVTTGYGTPMTPREVAKKLTKLRREHNIYSLLIGGGESTLNRTWLVKTIKELKMLNEAEAVATKKRIIYSTTTNASILSKDYIDELIEAGLNRIIIEIKSQDVNIFEKITGIHNRDHIKRYIENTWNAIKYINDTYFTRCELLVSSPYNKDYNNRAEIIEIGKKIASLNKRILYVISDHKPLFRATFTPVEKSELISIVDELKKEGLRVLTTANLDHYTNC